MKITPDMQTGPAGFIFTWALIIAAGIGLLFATGLGGALVWTGMVAVALILAYFAWKKLIRRLT